VLPTPAEPLTRHPGSAGHRAGLRLAPRCSGFQPSPAQGVGRMKGVEPNAADSFSRPLHLAARNGLRVPDARSQVGQLPERPILSALLPRRGRGLWRANERRPAARQAPTTALARPPTRLHLRRGVPEAEGFWRTGRGAGGEAPVHNPSQVSLRDETLGGLAWP